MLITRTSTLTGITRTRELHVTEQQIQAHAQGMLAQNAFPNLEPPEREFIISGITDDEWNRFMVEPDYA